MLKSDVEKRLNELLAGRQGLLAELSAQDGAIAECRYWLEVVSAEAVTDGPTN